MLVNIELKKRETSLGSFTLCNSTKMIQWFTIYTANNIQSILQKKLSWHRYVFFKVKKLMTDDIIPRFNKLGTKKLQNNNYKQFNIIHKVYWQEQSDFV